jgi:hypothetical protein
MFHVRSDRAVSGFRNEWEGTVEATLPVPVVTLDALIGKYGVPSFAKIDVEGFELEVLIGLSTPIPALSFEYHRSEAEARKVESCLNRLAALAPIEVNVTPQEDSHFAFPRWVPAEDFPLRLQSDLTSKPEFGYGDVFVRTRR